MKQEGYYCYIEDCIVYASDHPEDRESIRKGYRL